MVKLYLEVQTYGVANEISQVIVNCTSTVSMEEVTFENLEQIKREILENQRKELTELGRSDLANVIKGIQIVNHFVLDR